MLEHIGEIVRCMKRSRKREEMKPRVEKKETREEGKGPTTENVSVDGSGSAKLAPSDFTLVPALLVFRFVLLNP